MNNTPPIPSDTTFANITLKDVIIPPPPNPLQEARDAHDSSTSLLIALSKLTNALRDLAQARSDALTLALRLYGESPESFSPETAEVMDRYRPIINDILADPSDNLVPFCPACLSYHQHLTPCLTPR